MGRGIDRRVGREEEGRRGMEIRGEEGVTKGWSRGYQAGREGVREGRGRGSHVWGQQKTPNTRPPLIIHRHPSSGYTHQALYFLHISFRRPSKRRR